MSWSCSLRPVAHLPKELQERCLEIRTVDIPPRPSWQRAIAGLLRGEADLAERFRHPQLEQELKELLARYTFDAAQLEGLEMTAYLPLLVAAGVRIIYDAHNAEANLQETAARLSERFTLRAYSQVQAARLQRYEAELCAAVDDVIAVSEEDAAVLAELAPSASIRVIPNSIHTHLYAGARVEAPRPTLVFTGKMDYRPNVDAVTWFAREIWPQIRIQNEKVELQIVGKDPTPAIQRLAQDERIMVTGEVAEMLPYLLSCTVFIAPLRMGSGTRLKLLEAMAAGCAIVASPLAAAGLAGAGEAYTLAESVDGFAQETLELLADPQRRQQMGLAARALVAARYDWAQTAPQVQEIYD